MNHASEALAFFCLLPTRGIVEIGGADAPTFLGDLFTGDVAGLENGGARYAALLSPQGKVLFDFILFRREGLYLADLPDQHVGDFVKRLSLYKLRARVDIRDRSDLRIGAAWGGPSPHAGYFSADPRVQALGFRGPLARDEIPAPPLVREGRAEDYHAQRIGLCVPEAPDDFAYGDVFAHDIGLDQLNAVDFKKGCYIGQEVVSRMEHRGTARRRIVSVQADATLPPPGTELVAGGRPVGQLGTASGHTGLAIARLDRAHEAMRKAVDITAADTRVRLGLPAWASYTWPGDAGT
ncbi:MAG: CAF17-like 4Fe-4S cluster assembly/insertion protein YgfZ [Alphaproteobacteria bacterium]